MFENFRSVYRLTDGLLPDCNSAALDNNALGMMLLC